MKRILSKIVRLVQTSRAEPAYDVAQNLMERAVAMPAATPTRLPSCAALPLLTCAWFANYRTRRVDSQLTIFSSAGPTGRK